MADTQQTENPYDPFGSLVELLRDWANPAYVIAQCDAPQVRKSFGLAADRIEALEKEVHDLNWALGTEGYEQLSDPAEKALSDQAHAEIMQRIAAMGLRRKRLHLFLRAAAGEGLNLDGVDACELYEELFPAEYAAEVAGINEGVDRG